MWNCTTVPGSSKHYEFIGIAPDGLKSRLVKRHLPCPCHNCYLNNYDECSNVHIVGRRTMNQMKEIFEDCPAQLNVPLSNYTTSELKTFIKLYNDNKVPRECVNKTTTMHYIMEKLSHLVIRDRQDEDALNV